MNQQAASAEQVLLEVLRLEGLARRAENSETLAFTMVNDSQTLFGFRHAALIINGRVRAATGVSVPDPHSPFVAFIERAGRQLLAAGKADSAGEVSAEWLDQQTRNDWLALSAPQAFWLPLKDRQQRPIGGLWFARDAGWQSAERQLLTQLGETYSHAWQALEPRGVWRVGLPKKRLLIIVAVAVCALFIPVRQSVLAPAEVVPLNGRIITAPLDGVVADVLVKPNQQIKKDQLLLRFDSTTLKAQTDVAERALGVAEAELRSGSQRAFQDTESKARLDLLTAQMEQKKSELMYANELLSRTEVRAARDGIAVFADDDSLRGRPVKTGERLMELADPQQAALKVELDVGDAIRLPDKATVALFPDSDPLSRYEAVLERSAYEATLTPQGTLSYRLDAHFIDAAPRIGLRGTAKVYGQYTPLGIYLFRRPVAALRKALGV